MKASGPTMNAAPLPDGIRDGSTTAERAAPSVPTSVVRIPTMGWLSAGSSATARRAIEGASHSSPGSIDTCLSTSTVAKSRAMSAAWAVSQSARRVRASDSSVEPACSDELKASSLTLAMPIAGVVALGAVAVAVIAAVPAPTVVLAPLMVSVAAVNGASMRRLEPLPPGTTRHAPNVPSSVAGPRPVLAVCANAAGLAPAFANSAFSCDARIAKTVSQPFVPAIGSST